MRQTAFYLNQITRSDYILHRWGTRDDRSIYNLVDMFQQDVCLYIARYIKVYTRPSMHLVTSKNVTADGIFKMDIGGIINTYGNGL